MFGPPHPPEINVGKRGSRRSNRRNGIATLTSWGVRGDEYSLVKRPPWVVWRPPHTKVTGINVRALFWDHISAPLRHEPKIGDLLGTITLKRDEPHFGTPPLVPYVEILVAIFFPHNPSTQALLRYLFFRARARIHIRNNLPSPLLPELKKQPKLEQRLQLCDPYLGTSPPRAENARSSLGYFFYYGEKETNIMCKLFGSHRDVRY